MTTLLDFIYFNPRIFGTFWTRLNVLTPVIKQASAMLSVRTLPVSHFSLPCLESPSYLSDLLTHSAQFKVFIWSVTFTSCQNNNRTNCLHEVLPSAVCVSALISLVFFVLYCVCVYKS